VAVGDQKSVPDVTCDDMSRAKGKIRDAGFTATVGSPVESDCPEGTAADTDPSGRAPKGGAVVIRPSQGKADKQGGQDQPDNGGPPSEGPKKPRR
jgi:beta-lactam-binding protein with PASTA domain